MLFLMYVAYFEILITKYHCECLLSILSMNGLSTDMYIIAPTLVHIVDLQNLE